MASLLMTPGRTAWASVLGVMVFASSFGACAKGSAVFEDGDDDGETGDGGYGGAPGTTSSTKSAGPSGPSGPGATSTSA
ncbi:MAG: hypothetical protein HOV80_14655, partial [Polyangiaceae bacterium]|nr:hypothetical protein [Polyangiaceae bacterium]